MEVLTPHLRITPCRVCGGKFGQDRRSRYTICGVCRTPAAMAAWGYGWEDLVVMTGITREQARAIVFRKAEAA